MRLALFGASGFAIAVALAAASDCAVAKGYTVVHTFGGSDGSNPFGALITDGHHNFYGTTNQGGTANLGTVFKIAADGTQSVLHSFTGGSDGSGPRGSLVRDKQGNLYGTTWGGGSGAGGTIFKIATDGTESVLYAFTGGSDGSLPEASLALDKSGNLYGTASSGGNDGGGTIFELSAGGTFSVLYTFTFGSDGGIPFSSLLRDSAGNLYGTTTFGGDNTCGSDGCGVVFRFGSDGTYKVLHTFENTDGASPEAGLAADKAGNLYGTTLLGGDNCFGTTCGVVFELPPDGSSYSVLYTFTGGSDGGEPSSVPVVDVKGNVYGTARIGGSGCSVGCGTVFKVTPQGTESVLHAFAGPNDGSDPLGGVILIKKTLFGTADEGGNGANEGVTFKLKD